MKLATLRGTARMLAAGYAGASVTDPDLAQWRPSLWSAQTALSPDRPVLAARIHDLARNDGWASGGVTRQVDAVIGAGWRLAGIGERIVEGGVVLQGAGERIDHVAFEHGRPLGGRIGDKVGRMLDDSGRQPFAIVDGVALIPIEGTLVHKGAYVGAYSGRTSYEGDPAICQRSRTRSAKPHGCHAVPPCERAWRKSG